jgi:hypothetical protein
MWVNYVHVCSWQKKWTPVTSRNTMKIHLYLLSGMNGCVVVLALSGTLEPEVKEVAIKVRVSNVLL